MIIPKPLYRLADFAAPDQLAPALTLLAAGDTGGCLQLLEQAFERYPNDTRIGNFLGVLYLNSGRVDNARTLFMRSAALAKGVSVYAYNEGSALLLSGRPREALAAFLRSLNGDDLIPDAHVWAWIALMSCGEASQAVSKLRDALRYQPAGEQPQPSSMRVDLDQVTLCAIDCIDTELAARALRRSMSRCQFGAIKLLTSIPCRYEGIETTMVDPITSISEYSRFVMRELYAYIDTPFVLVTQWDGYVVNPDAWSDEFLSYDYVGAKWDEEALQAVGSKAIHSVGNGGFSLRSRRLLSVGKDPKLLEFHPEDSHLCRTYRPYLETQYGVRYAGVEVADQFSFEAIRTECKSFGFHGYPNLCCFEADPAWMRFEFMGPEIYAI